MLAANMFAQASYAASSEVMLVTGDSKRYSLTSLSIAVFAFFPSTLLGSKMMKSKVVQQKFSFSTNNCKCSSSGVSKEKKWGTRFGDSTLAGRGPKLYLKCFF